MENIVITAATPEELRFAELGRQLRRYNYGFVGEYPEQQQQQQQQQQRQ